MSGILIKTSVVCNVSSKGQLLFSLFELYSRIRNMSDYFFQKVFFSLKGKDFLQSYYFFFQITKIRKQYTYYVIDEIANKII